MVRILLLFLFCFSINFSFSQGTDVLSAEQFCSGTSSLTFNNNFGGTDLTQVGCLGSIPNASYFYLEIDQPGDLIFNISQQDLLANPTDVDFIAWGPFTDLTDADNTISFTDCAVCPNNTDDPTYYPYLDTVPNPDSPITDCSYDASSTETLNILNALQGEIYVVLITNFTGTQGTIDFQQTGGNGTTTCSALPVCGSQFYDTGGDSGNYFNNESYTTTINPYFAGGTVTVDFTSFNLGTGDVLTAYNGPNNTFPVLGTVTTAPSTFTSTTAGNPSGAISFEFTSDGTNTSSGWIADITCTNPPTCGSTYYDSGGATGDYSNNESIISTYYPDTPGDAITATFTAFSTESSFDELFIYDGPNTSFPLLGVFSGSTIPGPFTSSHASGALTFLFDSDFSNVDSGYAVDMTCAPYVPPVICGSTIYDSGGPAGDYSNNELITNTYFPDTPGDAVTATFTAFSTEAGWDYLYIYDGPNTGSPLLGVFSGNSIPGPFTSSDPSGALTFVFDSDFSNVDSGYAIDLTCAPYVPPPVCGTTYYDSGGVSGNYSNDELTTTTFIPDVPGTKIVATFTYFDTESCCDELRIYDGPNDTFPLLGTYAGTALPPVWTSTHPSGALTFVFESDFLFTGGGYAVDITCVNICNVSITDTIYPLGSDDCTLDYTELNSNVPAPPPNNTIFSENFDGATFPTGWTTVNGASSANWIISNSSNAGGSPNEAMLDWTTGSHNSTWRLNSPLIDITGQTNLHLGFRHNFDVAVFGTSNIGIYVETSTDNISWTTQYSVLNPTADVISTENIDISALDGNTDLHVRFRLSGDTNYLLDWSIDNVVITADGTPSPPEVTWSPATGLYTDAALTTPYILGNFAGTVYAAPNGVQIYTATETANGCTDTVTVTHNRKFWNGSVNTDWNNAANWSPNGIPTNTNCIYIPNSGINPVISGTTDADGLNMTIANGGNLTQQSNSTLTIVNFVDVEAGGTYSMEDSSSLIQVDNVANTVDGTFTMDRNTNIRANDYVYWSSPVTSFNIENVSPATPNGYKYEWLPYVNRPPGPPGPLNFGEWASYDSGPMDVGKGYIVKGPTGHSATPSVYSATFSGTPNNGIIIQAIERSTYTGGNYTYQPNPGGDNILVTSDDDNWNFIGNPYPSAINAIDFLTHLANTNIDGVVYLWTHGSDIAIGNNDPFYNDYVYNYDIADYIAYNSSGTSSPSGFNGNIGAGQGFFVLMTDIGTAIEAVTFDNTMRSSTYANDQFYRNSNSPGENNNVANRIWLDYISDSGQTNTTLIAYVEGATNESDRMFDAATTTGNGLNLYSMIDDKAYLIQGRQLPFVDSDTVPIGINIIDSGIQTIAINSLEGLFNNTDQDIYLEDLATGIIHDLKDSPYTFSSDEGITNDRFILRYNSSSLGIDDHNSLEGIRVFEENERIVVKSDFEIIQTIEVFDILGRQLYSNLSVDNNLLKISAIKPEDLTLFLKIKLVDGKQKIAKIIF